MEPEAKQTPAKNGYKFSIDPFLLAGFVEEESFKTAIDLGTGDGILISLLSSLLPATSFTGIDIREAPIKEAREKNKNSAFINGDIREVAKLFPPNSFDMVVTNPPYRKVGEERISPDSDRAISMHETKLTLEELISASSHLLKPKGTLYLCHLPERESEIKKSLFQHGFGLKRLRLAKGKKGKEHFLLTIEAVKDFKGNCIIESDFLVSGSNGEQTEEMKNIYKKLKVTW